MRAWFCIGLLGCSTALSCAVPEAYAYDDPTVAVCQFTKFHGDDPAATGYKRKSVRIEQRKVFIDFERSLLNTAPRPETLECWFVERDGYFHVIDAVEAKKNACAAVENAARKEGASEDERSQWEQKQTGCFALYANPTVPWYEFESQIIEPLRATGIYPISIVDTKMRIDQ